MRQKVTKKAKARVCPELCYAACKSYLPVVEALLQEPGVDVNSEDPYGSTALELASLGREDAIVARLLNYPGIAVNHVHPNEDGFTALHNATCNNHPSTADRLLRLGHANVNLKDETLTFRRR